MEPYEFIDWAKRYVMYKRKKKMKTMFKFVGAGILGIFFLKLVTDNMGKIVYEGDLNKSKSINYIYEEDKYENMFNKCNKLTIQENGTKYECYDIYEKTNIEWINLKDSYLKNNNLERIVITREDGEIQTYFNPHVGGRNYIDVKNRQDLIVKEVFDKMNPLYNTIREEIRTQLRRKLNNHHNSYTSNIKSLY